MKGMEMGLRVLFVVVAILVVVIVLLAMFTGGAANIGKTLEQWWGGVPDEPKPCNLYTKAEDCSIFAGCQWCNNQCIPAGQQCVPAAPAG